MSFSTCFVSLSTRIWPLSTRIWPLSTRLSISWPGVAKRRDDQWNWLPECEQGLCRSRCIPNSRRDDQGVAVGGRKWFFNMSLSTWFRYSRHGGCMGHSLRVSLGRIQGQYKVAPVDAKETVWAAEAHTIFTFSAMGRS